MVMLILLTLRTFCSRCVRRVACIACLINEDKHRSLTTVCEFPSITFTLSTESSLRGVAYSHESEQSTWGIHAGIRAASDKLLTQVPPKYDERPISQESKIIDHRMGRGSSQRIIAKHRRNKSNVCKQAICKMSE